MPEFLRPQRDSQFRPAGPRRRPARLLAAALIAIALAVIAISPPNVPVLSAQASPPPAQASQPAAPTGADQQPPRPTIHVSVKEVQIPFSVYDKKGNLVLDLKKDDFRVFENGVEQKIGYFSPAANLPLRFGILIDTSSSSRDRLTFEKEAAMEFGYYVLAHDQDHLGFLMTFDQGPQVLQDYTSDPDDLTRALDGLQAAGGTALLDAVIEACQKNLLAAPGPGIPRRVLIIFSDGDDNLSKHSLAQAVDVALRADARIFTISSNGYGIKSEGDTVLSRLAEETDGRMFSPLNDLPSADYATGYTSHHQLGDSQNAVYEEGSGEYSSEISTAVTSALEAISNELTHQYAIGYALSNTVLDGKFRTVEIRTRRKDMEIHAKKGYYAVP